WQSQAPRNHGGAPAQTRSERVLKQPNEPPLLEGHISRSREGKMAHTFELMGILPPTPHDSPLPRGYTPGSDEGRLKLEELMAMCTKLSKHVLDLEKEKDAQAVEILNLMKRTVYAATSRVSTARALVSTARLIVSTVGLSTSATRTSTYILEDEMVTMAGTLIAIRQTRTRPSYLPRPTSVVIIDTKQEQRRLTTPPPSQLSDTRDKGKGIMVEPDPPVKIKRSDQGDLQLQADAELAQLLHQEELAQEEREQLTIEERAQFLVETIAIQRKFRAAQRATKIRSKPPTKTQLRNMMITYLKNMGKFYHNQLKGKSYEELQILYEREQKWINDFVPMDSKKEEKKSVEPESVGK
ncbi:hypothetical protein Tco_1000981, partial [Tanacetum coccineum]